MKKHISIIIALLLALLLAACGSPSDSSSEDAAPDSGQEQTTGDEGAGDAGEAVHPYAWLGLQEMPECNYLDIFSTSHYIKVSDVYVAGMSYVSKQTNAVDGINTYKDDEYNKVYSIEGKSCSLNKESKTYMEYDSSDLAEDARNNLTDAMENGTNIYGRQFKETGSGTIPVYSDQAGDTAEYEYYEYDAYVYPDQDPGDNSTIERYYMKDGDVFAIYTKTAMGDTVVESTEVIDSISGDIPEGTFEIPDLSDYEKIEY